MNSKEVKAIVSEIEKLRKKVDSLDKLIKKEEKITERMLANYQMKSKILKRWWQSMDRFESTISNEYRHTPEYQKRIEITGKIYKKKYKIERKIHLYRKSINVKPKVNIEVSGRSRADDSPFVF